ncbi:hypothetical protein EBZ39_02810 [bacterium]|nr:hypothetical protein [bacterium]
MNNVDPNEAPTGYLAAPCSSNGNASRCTGCALWTHEHFQRCLEANCFAEHRHDGREVIFVTKKNDDQS